MEKCGRATCAHSGTCSGALSSFAAKWGQNASISWLVGVQQSRTNEDFAARVGSLSLKCYTNAAIFTNRAVFLFFAHQSFHMPMFCTEGSAFGGNGGFCNICDKAFKNAPPHTVLK